MLTVIGRWKQVLALALATASLSVAAAQPKQETVSDRVNAAGSAHKDVEDRVKAIESLATVTKEEESDNRVIETLLDIVNKEKDIFVRIPAIKTLGLINQNVTRDNKAKTKYLEPFVAILKDPKEHVQVRVAVASVFKNTLDPKSLPDVDKAFKPGILAIATNKGEKAVMLRAACIRAVGEFGDPSRIEELAAILSETDPPQEIREAAADAIYGLLNKAQQLAIPVPTVNKLVELVNDEKLPNELRVRVMKVVAQLIREDNITAKSSGMAVILKTVEKADKDFMIKGAVEALGIIGSGEAVIPLKKTYEELIKPNADPTLGPSSPGNIEIRVAIMRALRSVLSVQTSKKNADLKAVSEAVTLLIRACAGLKDIQPDPAPAVQDAAVFSLRYVYPFEAEHEDVVFALIFVIRENKNEEFKKKAAETLSYITQVDFGLDYQRWFDWFEKKYPKRKK